MSSKGIVYSSLIAFVLMTILVIGLFVAYFVLGPNVNSIVPERIGTIIAMLWFISLCSFLLTIALTYP